MADRLFAPWTPEQVDALNDYQRDAPMHPFTCANRGIGHRWHDDMSDLGMLIATENGWVCRDCAYTQNWAHPWMADTSWWQD